MIPLKLYGLIALAIAMASGLLYHRHVVKQRDRLQIALSAADAVISGLKHDAKIAKEASDAYQADLTRLSSERAKPLSVRLCRSPAVQAGSAAAERPGSASAGHVGEEASRDIGGELLEYGIACEANALQLDRLQQWVRSR